MLKVVTKLLELQTINVGAAQLGIVLVHNSWSLLALQYPAEIWKTASL
jgi:hypothetical protein